MELNEPAVCHWRRVQKSAVKRYKTCGPAPLSDAFDDCLVLGIACRGWIGNVWETHASGFVPGFAISMKRPWFR